MATVVNSGVMVSSEREMTNVIDGVRYTTLPVADLIHGRVIARYGIAITADQATGEMMMLHLASAWQEVADLAAAVNRAQAVFPVGIPIRYNEVQPGFVIHLAADDARAYGCEYSYVQPYGERGEPKGAPIDGCIAVTERALWVALQQAGVMPGFSAISASRATGRIDTSKTISFGDLKAGAAYVQQHGPVPTLTTRTVDGKVTRVEMPAFPSGGQREAAQEKVAKAVESVAAKSRLASLLGSR